MKEFARRLDLTPLSFGVLRVVLEDEPVRAKEIGTALDLDKSVISHQIALLRDRGLVEANPDPHDRRSSLLTSTDKAITAIRETLEESETRARRALQGWTVEDLQRLSAALERYDRDMASSPEEP